MKQLTQLVWYNIAVSLNHDGTDGPSGIQSSRLPVIRHVHTAAVISDLLTYLPHPNPFFALGSRLDRQWFPWITNYHIGDGVRFAVYVYRPIVYPPPAQQK